MVIALAGRRIDAPEAQETRFPLSMKEAVGQRLRDFFTRREATSLVCSAACGADLLALDAAGEVGIRCRIVLPFSPERFRETSVTDRPGDWGPLYDRIAERIAASGDLVVLPDGGDQDDAYAATNEAILDEALQLARGKGEGDVLAVIVWEGRTRGEGDLTDAFAASALARGIEVAEVLTR